MFKHFTLKFQAVAQKVANNLSKGILKYVGHTLHIARKQKLEGLKLHGYTQ